ncbi:cystathionine beta-lyase [Caulobacter segnis]|uniref:cystathionine beta-lyase n=1 Tax=Caulobacter segnis TaxID=88688 RepID=UPI00240F616D|nr:cystathionine beta-lyase [Caulobacter segnis]MDG2522934.1 cystathionine beta-lyase [Caulobacter segnis]
MTELAEFGECTRTLHAGATSAKLLKTPGPVVQRGSTVLMPTAEALYDATQTTYGRGGLATHKALCETLSELEHAERTFIYPSGLAAITGVLQALTGAGDHILVSDAAYNPTRRFLDGTLARFGVRATYYDPTATAEEIAALIEPETRLIYMESPASLTFEMQDIPAIAAMARARNLITVVDNTWAAGVLFKPLDHGVDVSIQALTKYVCGHSDVFMGSAAASGRVVERLARSSYEIGWAVSPDDAYLALRGLRTLHSRLTHHGASALKVAQWLQDQPEVASVLCPALPSFAGHDLWRRDFTGLCGLFGAILKPVDRSRVDAMVESLQLFGLGYSWGGFESLALPCDPQLVPRLASGRLDGPLLRLHIGLEGADDLIADLRRGLDSLTA